MSILTRRRPLYTRPSSRYYHSTDDEDSSSDEDEDELPPVNDRPKLRKIIDVRHGLLDWLRQEGLLTSYQIDVIMKEPYDTEKADRLFKYVTHFDSKDRRRFREVLRDTGQAHVLIYWIYGACMGRPKNVNRDLWPLLMDAEIHNAFKCNNVELIEHMDPDNGLLDGLLAKRCINKQHYEYIDVGETKSNKNRRLRKIILRRSVGDFDKFIRCLVETKQGYIASLLAPKVVGIVPPIKDSQKKRLKEMRQELIAIIDPENGLLDELTADECITTRQRDRIQRESDPAKKIILLLDLLESNGQPGLDKFVECLKKSGQSHVARKLRVAGRSKPDEGHQSIFGRLSGNYSNPINSAAIKCPDTMDTTATTNPATRFGLSNMQCGGRLRRAAGSVTPQKCF